MSCCCVCVCRADCCPHRGAEGRAASAAVPLPRAIDGRAADGLRRADSSGLRPSPRRARERRGPAQMQRAHQRDDDSADLLTIFFSPFLLTYSLYTIPRHTPISKHLHIIFCLPALFDLFSSFRFILDLISRSLK